MLVVTGIPGPGGRNVKDGVNITEVHPISRGVKIRVKRDNNGKLDAVFEGNQTPRRRAMSKYTIGAGKMPDGGDVALHVWVY